MEENITYYGESITGRRSNNEDSFLCEKLDDKTYLFIVADGMGGSEHGEVASKLAAGTFSDHIKESFQKPVSKTLLKSILEEGFKKAQTAIKVAAEDDKDHSGMGTTFVVLLIHDDSYVWGNIGDSRLYVIDQKGIQQITRDHTYIEEILKKIKGGNITEGHLDQYSHIITRSVSGGNDKPDLFPEDKDYLNIRSQKVFLLCSDGLISKKSNKKDESGFFLTYQSNQEPESLAKELVRKAFENGSEDNITAVCVYCSKTALNTQKIFNKTKGIPDTIKMWIKKNTAR